MGLFFCTWLKACKIRRGRGFGGLPYAFYTDNFNELDLADFCFECVCRCFSCSHLLLVFFIEYDYDSFFVLDPDSRRIKCPAAFRYAVFRVFSLCAALMHASLISVGGYIYVESGGAYSWWIWRNWNSYLKLNAKPNLALVIIYICCCVIMQRG